MCISTHYTEAYLYNWPEICSISCKDQTWLISNYRTVCQATVASWTPVLSFGMLAPWVEKEYHTSRFCRRKANTVSTSAVRAATISLLRGGASPSGKVWISSVRRRKINRTSSTWVGCCERIKGEGEKVEGKRNREMERGRENDCQAGVFLFAITCIHTP